MGVETYETPFIFNRVRHHNCLQLYEELFNENEWEVTVRLIGLQVQRPWNSNGMTIRICSRNLTFLF